MWLRVLCVTLLSSALALSQAVPENQCPPLSKDIKQRVEDYLAHRLVSGTNSRPSIKAIDSMADSCYRKLTLNVPGASGEVVMYLSPDERFLTSMLYDLAIDPKKEVTRIAGNVTKLLLRDRSPQFNGSNNPITLVEFVDFQCPYCKRFAEWYSVLPESLRNQTTLVFKNLPLSQHPWARPAASYAVCASEQSSLAFHELTEFFFQKQSEITLENLKLNVLASLAQSSNLNAQQFETCALSTETSQIIERDISIAKQLNVNNTPTLFINGRRVMRVDSADELRRLLETELADKGAAKGQSEQFSGAR